MPPKDPEKQHPCRRERDRRLAAERVAAGWCPKCGAARPEPERRMCAECNRKRREADRARYARAKASGALYGGKRAEAKRRSGRAGSKRRYKARQDAGLCVRCGLRPPVEESSRCEPCRSRRNDGDKQRWAARRSDGRCGACGDPAPRGAARCEACARLQAGRPSRKIYARKQYARRRSRNACVDCGAPSQGAARCPECARRSYLRSPEHRGLPVSQPRFTVIEIDTGVDHGTYDSPAEVAACLAFAKLGPDDVEIVSDVSVMASLTSW